MDIVNSCLYLKYAKYIFQYISKMLAVFFNHNKVVFQETSDSLRIEIGLGKVIHGTVVHDCNESGL